jgi:branched-chain amino acid transport system ATP-binding protein
MAEALLALRGLTRRFGALTVTDNLSLDVQAGRIHAVIGPNGAGKTSLMQLVSGFLRPDAGSILLDGRDVTRLAAHRRARLGLARCFQVTAVLAEMPVLENVALAAQAAAGVRWGFVRAAGRQERFNRPAMAALAAVGLAELAMALAQRPRVLLLDEPLAGAGPEETPRLVALLAGLRGRCAVLLIEHDMDAVFALADTVSVLDQGRLIATGTPAAIRADAAVQAAYLGAAP